MSKKQEDIIATAKERFERALTQESHNVARAKSDIRFAAASPDDPWQWEDRDVNARKAQARPMLTINKMPQHIRQVTNDIRQNRPQVKFRPADSRADPKGAEILNGLLCNIYAHSDAYVAYDTAADGQVTHGLGYIRVMADYVNERSFDQDIFIKPVDDPFKCKDDPDAKLPAGEDRKWFFIEDSMSEEEFKADYPKAEAIDWTYAASDDWFAGKRIRVVEYFEKVDEEAELLLFTNGATMFEGDPLPQGVVAAEKPIKTRKSYRCKVVWRKMNGQEVLEEREFPSKFIPVARVVGNEWKVDGKVYRSGLVRNAKDSQRMYNVAQSAVVERVMMAPKSPWLIAGEGVEGYEQPWQTANTANHSYLPFNAYDDEGRQIPMPQRTAPASIEPGLNQIAMGASEDIKAETGQYDASLGQRSNETSGRAIMARQREGDNATYHYIDNLARGVRHIGRIVLDMIPRIYDTKRVARILGEDGSINSATIDPQAPEAVTERPNDAQEIERIFNPNVGFYDIYTTTGPSFSTRRVEAVEAMTAMTQANPQLWGVIGDQLVKNMDWPGAEGMAERLRLTLIPEVKAMVEQEGKADALPPQAKMAMDQMQQQLQALDAALQEASAKVQQLEADKQSDFNEQLIKAYDAETKRLTALGTAMTPEQVQILVMQTLQQAMTSPDPTPQMAMEPQMMEPPPMQEMPPPMEMEQQPEPAQAGFLMSEGPL